MLSTFLIIEVRSPDCLFIEFNRTGSLYLLEDVWEIYASGLGSTTVLVLGTCT